VRYFALLGALAVASAIFIIIPNLTQTSFLGPRYGEKKPKTVADAILNFQ